MGDSGRRRTRTVVLTGKKDDGGFRTAMDDWYLDLVKKRRITPQIYDALHSMESLNSITITQSIVEKIPVQLSEGSVVRPWHVLTRIA
jgi:hypothetical protein